VDRVHDPDEGVDADQVGERDRSHRQAGAEPHGRVDVLLGRVPRVDHADSLVEVGEQQLVRDEATPVADDHRGLADGLGEPPGDVDHALVGHDGADQLDELHHRCRVEEVEPEDAVRAPRVDRDVHHGQRRGVGRQDRVPADDLVDTTEGVLLEAEHLRHGLDDEIAVGEDVPVGGPADPPDDVVALALLELASGHVTVERPGDPRVAPLDRLTVELDERHRVPVPGDDLGDARPHRAAADDADLPDLGDDLAHGCSSRHPVRVRSLVPRRASRARCRASLGRAPRARRTRTRQPSRRARCRLKSVVPRCCISSTHNGR
jgi:hypothetical protein